MSNKNLQNTSVSDVGGADGLGTKEANGYRLCIRDAVAELLEMGGRTPHTHEELARISGVKLSLVREVCPSVGDVVGAARRVGKRLMLPGDRRAAILQAGLEFVRANGYSAVTCEAVGVAAGCSYNTVRRHWPNREALAQAIALEAKQQGDKALWKQGVNALARSDVRS